DARFAGGSGAHEGGGVESPDGDLPGRPPGDPLSAQDAATALPGARLEGRVAGGDRPAALGGRSAGRGHPAIGLRLPAGRGAGPRPGREFLRRSVGRPDPGREKRRALAEVERGSPRNRDDTGTRKTLGWIAPAEGFLPKASLESCGARLASHRAAARPFWSRS